MFHPSQASSGTYKLYSIHINCNVYVLSYCTYVLEEARGLWATCTHHTTCALHAHTTQHVGYMHTPHNMWATCTHHTTCGLHAHTARHVGYMHTPHNMWATCTHHTTCGLHAHTAQHVGYMYTPHSMRATCTHHTTCGLHAHTAPSGGPSRPHMLLSRDLLFPGPLLLVLFPPKSLVVVSFALEELLEVNFAIDDTFQCCICTDATEGGVKIMTSYKWTHPLTTPTPASSCTQST